MKYRPILFLIFTLLAINSCSTTTQLTTYSEQQLAEGTLAVKEMMVESFTAAVDKTRDDIEMMDENILFNEIQRNQYQQLKELPGVNKRLNTFKKQLTIELNTIFDTLFDQADIWMNEIEISDPYTYILGQTNSVSKLFEQTFSKQLKNYLVEQIRTKKRLNTIFSDYLTIVNAYIIHGKTESKEILRNWDSHNLIEFLVQEIIDETGTQEAIIRYLAPSYDSPYIQLFSR